MRTPSFFIDDRRNETGHEQVSERVNDDGGSGEPWMIQEIEVCAMAGVPAVRSVQVMGGLRIHRAQKHGYQHQSGAVRRGHQERPQSEIAEADTHSHPSGMSRADKAINSEPDEQRRCGPTQSLVRDARSDYCDERNNQSHRKRMTGSDWREGLPYGRSPPFLQS